MNGNLIKWWYAEHVCVFDSFEMYKTNTQQPHTGAHIFQFSEFAAMPCVCVSGKPVLRFNINTTTTYQPNAKEFRNLCCSLHCSTQGWAREREREENRCDNTKHNKNVNKVRYAWASAVDCVDCRMKENRIIHGQHRCKRTTRKVWTMTTSDSSIILVHALVDAVPMKRKKKKRRRYDETNSGCEKCIALNSMHKVT